MTTMYPAVKTCGNCGAPNDVMVISSTSSFGYVDLDTRPPPLLRHNLAHEIECCALCGYCSPNLEERPRNSKDVVQSVEYRSTLEGVGPTFLREFQCAAILAEADERFDEAGWFHLKCAWGWDDEDNEEEARKAREHALSSWDKALERNQPVATEPASQQLLLIDVARRAGRFDDAGSLARQSIDTDDEFLLRVLAYEIDLIEAGDTGCHSVEEIASAL
jgi:hypothetical protein